MQYKIIDLDIYKDPRGSLISFQDNANCPFPVQRAFYIFDTKDSSVIRGAHANKDSEFMLIVISGSCRVRIDDGKNINEVLLNTPQQALYLNKMVWKEMFEFSHNAVLLVLANTLYNENEYIRNYDDYIQELKKNIKENIHD